MGTLLVQALPEEPEKSIHDFMAKTIQSITVHDFHNKLKDILTDIMG